MKQVLFSLIFCAITFQVNAQITAKKHSWLFASGTGVGNTDLNNSQFQTHFHLKQILRPVLNINVSAKYFVTNRLAVGITGGVYHCSAYSESSRVLTPSLASTAGDYRVQYSSIDHMRHTAYISAEGSYVYHSLKRWNISMYATGGFGITHTTGYVDDRENAVYINHPTYITCYVGPLTPPAIDENKMIAYVAPVGIRGGKCIGWYLEAGYGYKGILNGGVSVKIK